MDKVIVSIGGSILIPDEDDSSYIRSLAAMLREMARDLQMVVICGGGRVSRYYSRTGRELGGNTRQLDELGIAITRVNAGLLRIALGDLAVDEIPHDAESAAALSRPGKVVVMGGTVPGHTTDAVAAMVGRALGASRIINATSVDAVYSEDPRANPDAERYSEMSIEELAEIVAADHGAGMTSVFDPLGVKIAGESGIDVLVVDGRRLEELGKAAQGLPFVGTHVHS